MPQLTWSRAPPSRPPGDRPRPSPPPKRRGGGEREKRRRLCGDELRWYRDGSDAGDGERARRRFEGGWGEDDARSRLPPRSRRPNSSSLSPILGETRVEFSITFGAGKTKTISRNTTAVVPSRAEDGLEELGLGTGRRRGARTGGGGVEAGARGWRQRSAQTSPTSRTALRSWR